jgi:hypothetical protein
MKKTNIEAMRKFLDRHPPVKEVEHNPNAVTVMTSLGDRITAVKALQDFTTIPKEQTEHRETVDVYAHPYDKKELINGLLSNAYHARACAVRSQYIVGSSYYITERGEKVEPKDVIKWIDELKYKGDSHIRTGRLAVNDFTSMGDGYIECMRDNKGEIAKLHYTAAQNIWKRVQVKGEPQGYAQIEEEQGRITKVLFNPFGTREANTSELYHLRNDNPINRQYGVPNIIYGGWNSLQIHAYINEVIKYFFVNRAWPDFLIILKGAQATDSMKETITGLLRDKVKGTKSSGSTAIIESPAPGVDIVFQPINKEIFQSDVGRLLDQTLKEIVTADNVLPAKVGIIDKGNLNGESTEEQLNDFLKDIALSREIFIEFMNDIIKDRFKTDKYSYNVVFDDTMRTLRQAQIDQIDWAAGIRTINEIRYKQGLEKSKEPEADMPWPIAQMGSQLINQMDMFDRDRETKETKPDEAIKQSVDGEIQQTALNGAQVSSLVEIITQIATGQLPYESGKQMILLAFPLFDEAKVNALLKPVKNFEPRTNENPKPTS